jgi:hypothetical protein
LPYRGERRRAFEVEVMDSASLRTFCAEIGILGKGDAVAQVASRIADIADESVHRSTPCPLEVWDDVIKAKGDRIVGVDQAVSRPASRPATTGTPTGGARDARPSPRWPRCSTTTVLRWWASPGVTWDRITAITPVGMSIG